MSDNLVTALLDGAEPTCVAIESPGIEGPDAATLTYGALAAASARYAAALATLGVRPGDRVAVQVEKSVPALVLYLACLRAGAVFLPLNTAYTPTEVGYFVGDAEPRLLVCDPGRIEALAPLAEAVGGLTRTLDAAGGGSLADLAAGCDPTFATVPRTADDLAAILYTSGTTGRSKGAMLTHDNLASNARTLVEAWRFGPGDRLVHALPIFHTHGLFVATNVMLLARGTILFLPRFDADAIVRLLPRATAMMGVPTFYTRLLAHPGLTREVVAGMRLFVSGSAPLLAETHRAWSERTGHAILERYGMTETNMNTSNPYDGARVPGSVGPPLPGVELRVTEPDTTTMLPQGETGMIEVRGPNVFSGYWRMPDKTAAEKRPDGWFVTGDLGRVDDKGYVHIVGRAKDLIISGGYNIYPKEIETEIDALPGVVESAVYGLPHADLGEAVAAAIVAEPGAEIDEAAVLDALSARLARFKLPRHLRIVDALPRNAMGKVQKNLLRADGV